MIRLDIFSDPVCPWCYIGKTYLDRALAAAEEPPFVIEWHPFQLNPDMPREGVDRKEYLEAKFGGPERAAEIYGRIGEAARAAGVDIDFDRIKRTPNTLDAHRLLHWAGLEGRQGLVKGALMRAYFREGRDIGDPEVLVEIARANGMDAEVTRRLLASDADLEAIRARDAHARERGVNAVPTFLIANQYVLQGAQPAEMWQNVIAELSQAAADAEPEAEAG